MTRVLAAAAVVAAVAFPMASPASADHVCVGIEKIGTFGPPLSIGPICQPTGIAHNCRTTDIGITPTLILEVYTCLPR